ncbi:MAG: TetR/AcrR family transcriptional regulator [Thermonemataceae bacterium]
MTAEEKIKEAARTVFHKKGFAATRTRDIAEEAGINLALLNYYFRSKKKLFDIIMFESFQSFFYTMKEVFNDDNISLEVKIETFVARYIDFIVEQPDLPIFLMNELRNNAEELFRRMDLRNFFQASSFFKQYQERIKAGHPLPSLLHFLANVMGLTVFPFITKPMLQYVGDLDEPDFREFVLERKKLIPTWIKKMYL